jgi:hypothetical protein
LPHLAGPGVGATQTFISFGTHETKIEAENCLKYIETKFVRALLATLKITQHNSPDTWNNVPLQGFTTKSDIDWSQSVEDIDKQLYKKYKLSKSEKEFIEKMIKPM